MSYIFLGISYILSGIPFLNILGIILIPIGWILLGKRFNRKLWIVTGVLGISLLILSFGLILYLFLKITADMEKIIYLRRFMISIKTFDRGFLLSNLQLDKKFIIMIIIWFLNYICYSISQLISLWVAGSVFNQILLKISVILSIVGVFLGIFFVIFPMIILLIIIIFYLSNIIAGIGFLLIRYERKHYTISVT